MARSDRNNRRADKAEFARHIATGETVAFMTALVGLLNEADANEHRGDREHRHLPREQPLAARIPTDTAPAIPIEDRPDRGDHHADTTEAPSGDASPALHADAAPVEDHPQDPGTRADGIAAGHFAAPVTIVPLPIVAGAPGHFDAAQAGAVHGDAAAPTAADPFSAIQQLGSTITHFVDASLATVAHTIESLTSTVTQLTSSLTGALGQIAGDLSGGLGGVTHAVTDLLHAPIASPAATPAGDMAGTAATGLNDLAGAHDGGLLDTAGAVPIATLHAATLHLGFLGQPTVDGHDMHDGAFSALGVHHF